MKKKIIFLLTAFMPLGMAIVGCNEIDPSVIQDVKGHAVKNTWSHDDTNHWVDCTHCSEKFQKGEHTWDEGTTILAATETSEGIKRVTCKICSATAELTISKLGSSGGNTGGGGSTTSGAGYLAITSLGDTTSAYIVASDGTAFNAMTNSIASDTLPWYINGVSATPSSDKTTCEIDSGADEYKFTKQTDGSYTIQSSDNKYLFSYTEAGTDKTHYSIGLSATTTDVKGGTVYWNVTSDNGAFTLKGTTTEVYLNKGKSFAGSQTDPTNKIYLFKKNPNAGTGGNTGGTGTPIVKPTTDSKWNLNFDEFGTTFRDSLAALITAKTKNSTTYSNCLGIGQKAAANGSGKFTPFYHGEDYAVSTSTGCNREHTWPNSRGGGEKAGGSNIEKDPFMVRPTITADNSARGNNFYGTGSKEWDPSSCGFEAARGESARVIFYVATRYGKSNGLSLSNNPSDADGKKTMGTLKTLLEWNAKYPVTKMEKQINDYLDDQGFGRNPFVDHPEYVDFIWNSNGILTSAPTTSSGAGGSTTGGSTTGGSTTGGSTTTNPTGYTLKDALADIDKAYIVTSESDASYFALTDTSKVSAKDNSALPWYIIGADTTVASDKSTCNITGTGAKEFNFAKQADGSYTIKTDDGKFLYSYVDDTHYSIGIDASPSKGTNNWTITKSGNGFVFKNSTLDVYLSYYQSSFCGKNAAPTAAIYLYSKDSGTTSGSTGGTTTGGTTGGSTTGGTTGGTVDTGVYAYTKIASVDEIDGSSICIVGINNNNAYGMMSSDYFNNGKQTYTWYLADKTCTVASDKIGMNASNAVKYTFAKQADGTYTIKSSGNKYLNSEVSGTHYNIGLVDAENATTSWTIAASGDGFTLMGTTSNIYLTSTFCWQGTNTAPANPIYLFK